jgi:hypothetical protein
VQVVREHLALRNPRFVCKDTSDTHELVVPLAFQAGPPATSQELRELEAAAGREAVGLIPLYREFNGVAFHLNRDTAGLLIASVEELAGLNAEWREWFSDLEPDELFNFQRDGVAFATIAASGNYFVIHKGAIYYSDHDSGDDSPWGENIEQFLERALSDPARFLYEAGCYTRYSDGETDRQFIPESFLHD